MRKITTVSCAGDKRYVRALKLIADQKGVHTGQLVRDAVDKMYGKAIAEVQASLDSILPQALPESTKRSAK